MMSDTHCVNAHCFVNTLGWLVGWLYFLVLFRDVSVIFVFQNILILSYFRCLVDR